MLHTCQGGEGGGGGGGGGGAGGRAEAPEELPCMTNQPGMPRSALAAGNASAPGRAWLIRHLLGSGRGLAWIQPRALLGLGLGHLLGLEEPMPQAEVGHLFRPKWLP